MSFLSPSLSALLALTILAALFATLVVIAVGDVKARLIRNTHVVLVIILFTPFVLFLPPFIEINALHHIGCALILFVFTFFCFTRGWMGGGDAKLIPALGLWLDVGDLLPFMLATALGGFVVAAVQLGLAAKNGQLKPREWRKLPLPYGVAIAGGGALVIGMKYLPTLVSVLQGPVLQGPAL